MFVDLLRASNTPMYLKTMDSLLQEDSQRILDIARHATVRDDASPEITFYAIRVLFHLSQVRVVWRWRCVVHKGGGGCRLCLAAPTHTHPRGVTGASDMSASLLIDCCSYCNGWVDRFVD